MNYCYIDIESQSNHDLKKRGVHHYAYAPGSDVRITMLGFAIDKTKVQILEWPKKLPDEIKKFKGTFVAHNALFDFTVIKALFDDGKSPIFDFYNWEDTSAVCRRLSLPAALDDISKVLGFAGKDEEGKKALAKYYKVVDIPKEDYKLILKYCKQDVELLRKVHKTLPPLKGVDKEIYQMISDELIRGIRVDKAATKELLRIVRDARERLFQRSIKEYGTGASAKTSLLTSPKLKDYVLEKWNLEISSFNKKVLQKIKIKNKNLPKDFLEMLKLREALTSNAYKKLDSIEASLVDETIHDFYIYHGAHTGRPAGRNVQIQNFRKPIKQKDPKTFAEEIKNLKKKPDIEIPAIVSSLSRGVLLPEKGYMIGSSDLSAIELRIALWIADSRKGLDLFRKYDADPKNNLDIYNDFGTRLNLPKPILRDVSKVSILSLDYGAGLERFDEALLEAGVEIEDTLVKKAFDGYHFMYPEIRFTHSAIMQEIFRVLNPKEYAKMRYPVDARNLSSKYKFEKRGETLVIISPSGRESYYHNVKTHAETKVSKKTGNPYTSYSISYDNYRGRKFATGASIFENMCQGLATEVFFHKALQIHKKYFVSFTVHDEAVTQIPKKETKKALEWINKIMKEPVDFVPGCPFNAKSVVLDRYYKQD